MDQDQRQSVQSATDLKLHAGVAFRWKCKMECVHLQVVTGIGMSQCHHVGGLGKGKKWKSGNALVLGGDILFCTFCFMGNFDFLGSI